MWDLHSEKNHCATFSQYLQEWRQNSFLAEKYWSLKQIREPRNSPAQRWSIDFHKETEAVSGGRRFFFPTGSEITGYP